MDAFVSIGDAFVELMVTVLPWFAAGTLTAAIVETLVPVSWAQRVLGGRSGLPAAVTAGAVLPGCSCTAMPLAAGLSGLPGARVGTLTAFVFVSPLLSPMTVLLTLSLLGWEMTTARVLASLAGSFAIGLIINRYERRFRRARELLPIAGADPAADSCANCSCQPTAPDTRTAGRWSALGQSARRILRRVLALNKCGRPPPQSKIPAQPHLSAHLAALGRASPIRQQPAEDDRFGDLSFPRRSPRPGSAHVGQAVERSGSAREAAGE
jgi:uncharacterized membrane protein YraQ (UPF0718 family)